MSEMIERVARAIHGKSAMSTSWEYLRGVERDSYLLCARAAIEAMREPTEEGVLNGLVPIVRDPELLDGDARELVKAIWRGVIDEALK